jgi:hypothetical protein
LRATQFSAGPNDRRRGASPPDAMPTSCCRGAPRCSAPTPRAKR